MKIKRIKLKDWGRHADLDATMDAQVIGLMGPNGCGKTLVLEAVEFALTGITKDKAESYVRDFGQGEAKNASVTLWFEKDGREGVIFRQVGATAKRKLEWDGAEFTKAKDVEEALSDIFGADRQAVSNAIFVSQGELDRMLFGTPSEREAMWLKLMLLNFMDARHDMVERKIGLLGSGLQDFTMHMDELNAQVSQAELVVGTKQAELEQLPDVTVTRVAWETMIRTDMEAGNAGRDLSTSTAKAREAAASTDAAMSKLHEYQRENCGIDVFDAVCIQQLRQVRDTMSEELMRADRALTRAKELRTAAAVYDKCLADYKQAEITWHASEKALAACVMPADYKESLVACRRGEQAAIAELSSSAKLDVARAANTQASKTLLDKSEAGRPWPDSKLVENAMQLSNTQADISLLELQVGVRRELVKHANGSDLLRCPVCGSDTDHLDPAAELSVLEPELEAAQAAHKDATELHNRMVVENTKYGKDVEVLQDRMRQTMTQMLQLEAEVASHALAAQGKTCNAWAKEITDLEQAMETWQALSNSHNTNTALLRDKVAQLKAVEDHPDRAEAAAAEPTAVWKAENEKARLQEVSDSINNQLSVIEDLLRKSESLKAVAETQRGTLQKLLATVALTKDLLLTLGQWLDQPADTWPGIVEALKIKERQRAEKAGELSQARQQADELRGKRLNLDARVQADARVRALIEQLRQLKETLVRGGLPMSYMNYTFGLLVDKARNHLTEMGANFDVAVDTGRALSMTFTRTDDATGYSLPQEKLSGGQKVRLTIAMLLAIQSLLLSDVGLLVLDEPSNHVDEEGVERLRDLLFDIGRHLGTTDMQMLVCDHKEPLVPAFGAVIRIK